MSSDQALFIIQSNLSVGGIESYFAQLMRGCAKAGDSVFWLCDEPPEVDATLSDFLQGVTIVPVRTKRIHRHVIPSFDLRTINKVAIVCAYIKHMVFAEHLRNCIKRKHPKITINAFYLVPHFTGCSQFPDTAFDGLLSKYVFERYRIVVKKWIDREEIIYFAQKHFQALNEHYHLQLEEGSARFVPDVAEVNAFDFELARQKAVNRGKQFNIISAARLEFPHKGYLLGLVDVFSKLVSEFPQVRLTIIGDGPDANELLEIIGQQRELVKDRIICRGFVSLDELRREMRKANLNIGMAGSLLIGAQEGTLSIPVRHYTKLCESPGFLSPDASDTLITDTCGGVYDLIRQAINMDCNEYVERSHASYCAVNSDSPDYSYFFKIKNNIGAVRITQRDLLFVQICMYSIGIKTRIKKLLNG